MVEEGWEGNEEEKRKNHPRPVSWLSVRLLCTVCISGNLEYW